MAALQKLSLHYKFGEYLKTELRNHVVYGLRNQRIQGRFVETANLTMESTLKTASEMELAEKGVSELKTKTAAAVAFVGADARRVKKKDDEAKHKGQQKTSKHGKNTHYKSKSQPSHNSKSNSVSCYRCGRNYLASDCTLPRHVKCHECGGQGHLQKVCKKKCKMHVLEVFRLDKTEHARFRENVTVSLYLEKRRVSFEVDCGAAVTLVSEKWLRKIFPRLKIQKTQLRLRSYCKQTFAPLGFVKVRVRDINDVRDVNMYVVHYDRNPLLGRE
ncbi:uncharacterized protein [Temnothorax longispinosus]|uniref:uncharacterized protein n=1 Tax=Temnothorax longispinosus TaxID=300112 RepID=UPI003A999F3E